MSKKISKEEFLERFYKRYPTSSIELLEYTAISKSCKIKCNICGNIYEKAVARKFLSNFSCCGAKDESQFERAKRLIQENQDFEIIKKLTGPQKDFVIIKHLKCGNEYRRTIQSVIDNPFACTYCETYKQGNMLSKEEVQQQLDAFFHGQIEILDYKGQMESCHYKCHKCGLIFTRIHICEIKSKGCPKCDKKRSRGERFIAQLLEEKGLVYKEQVGVQELPLQKFDFAIYDGEGNISYFIEVQGEQHFEQGHFFEPLEKVQERDNRKREYCKAHNIPLYELIYKKGKFKNLDILPC